MRTIVFGSGMSDKTDIKMEAYDMRERYTSTKTLLGKILYLFQYKMKLEFLYYDLEKKLSNKYFFYIQNVIGTAKSSIQEIKQSGRIRLKLESPNPDGRTAGFVTLNAWSFDSKIPASTG